MIIGVILSGFLAGFAALVGALSFGFPLWAAVMLYPIAGTAGAVCFISLIYGRHEASEAEGSHELVTE
ncbi:MAG: hypothetical protein WBA92_16650 [Pseudorhodobacter sp.]